MYKLLIIFYLACFFIYVLFSRQPDFFDGELTKATIGFIKDSKSGKEQATAFFTINKKNYQAPADYLFRSFNQGQTVDIIYEAAKPSNAAVYSFWGYWLQWKELLLSIGLLIAMYYLATAITSNPSPEALLEQLEEKPIVKRKKYND